MYMMIDVGLELLVEDQPIYIIVVFAASDWTWVSVKRHVHTETKPQDTSRKPPTPGGGTPRKIGWECAARVPKPLPYLWPKSAIFPTLFMTWPKIRNPIYDLTITSKSC